MIHTFGPSFTASRARLAGYTASFVWGNNGTKLPFLPKFTSLGALEPAYICGATHDFNDPAFPLLAYTTTVGPYAWVCARAVVSPGVNLAEGAIIIIGLASVATRDLEPLGVYAGVPAAKVEERTRTSSSSSAFE